MTSRFRLSVILSFLTLLPACVSTDTDEGLQWGTARGLDYPDQRQLVTWGQFHDVEITLEFEEEVFPEVVYPRRRGNAEVFRFGERHEVEFRNTVVYVEDQAYEGRAGYGDSARVAPPDRRELTVFLPRLDSWTFRFWGIPITVEHNGWWKPVILRDRTYGEDKVDRNRLTFPGRNRRSRRVARNERIVERPLKREELQVGPHRIILDPVKLHLDVNNRRVPLRDGLSIEINARGRVTYAF